MPQHPSPIFASGSMPLRRLSDDFVLGMREISAAAELGRCSPLAGVPFHVIAPSFLN